MALIPPETIEAIRSKLDIVELVSEYVPGLSRAGRNMKGRCPFHQERTPSFIVSPERQTFHCFGCGEGGDVFTFLRKIENLSFGEAAEKLAARVGVRIESTELGPEQKERLKLKELLEFAAGHYHAALGAPDAAAARQYFAKRHLSEAVIKDFQLGFASKSGSLVDAALKKGFTKDQLVKAGLAAVRDGGRVREYFFDRVLFPIRDAKGSVVGFGGRTMGDGEPKYLNTPETPVFSKGRVLYALSQASPAIRKARQLLLMEGYMDVIASHQHGIQTACAPLGTALTPEHATLVKRHASDVVIVFDADNAGINAAVRGAEILLAAGLSVRIATVPSGKDPDEHLHQFGAAAFQKDCLDKAVDLVEFKTETLLKRAGTPLTPESKSAIAKDVLATIAQCPDEILKAEWTRRLSQRLDVQEGALKRQLDKTPGVKQPAPRATERHEPAALTQEDEQLLVLLLKDAKLTSLVDEGDLASKAAKTIWKGLKEVSGSQDWAGRLLDSLPEGERVSASQLLVLVGELQSEDTPGLVKSILAKRRGLVRLKEIEPKVMAGDAGLKGEYLKLLSELKGSRR